jgi:hypothetical protein
MPPGSRSCARSVAQACPSSPCCRTRTTSPTVRGTPPPCVGPIRPTRCRHTSSSFGRQPPGILVPTSDASLEAVAEHRGVLAAHHRVACPPAEVAQMFLDKRLTSEVACRAGVAAPLHRRARDRRGGCRPRGRDQLSVPGEAAGELPLQPGVRREDAPGLGLGTIVQELIPGPEANGVNYNVYVVDGAPPTGTSSTGSSRSHSPGSGASTGSTSSRTSGPS